MTLEKTALGGIFRVSCLLTPFILQGCVPPEAVNRPQTPFEFILNTVMFVVMGALLYWMLVTKPQIQREEEQQKFFEDMKKGDEVVLSSGVFGRVVSKKDDVVTVEIAKDTRVKVQAQHVHQVEKPKEGKGKDAGAEKSKKVSKG